MFLVALLTMNAVAQSGTLQVPIGPVYNQLGSRWAGDESITLSLYDDAGVELGRWESDEQPIGLLEGSLLTFVDVPIDDMTSATGFGMTPDGSGYFRSGDHSWNGQPLLDCSDSDPEPAIFTDDLDGDGYGDAHGTASTTGMPLTGATSTITGLPDTIVVGCTADPPGSDVAPVADCDDDDPDAYPGADEYCNYRDDDCDGTIDEDVVDSTLGLFVDDDRDGFGAGPSPACDLSSDHVANSDDCDDNDPATHPGADETCEPVDRDCDGELYTGAVDPAPWYPDADGDGWAPEAVDGVIGCTDPGGRGRWVGDCNDADATIYDGAPEACDDIDHDCDGDPVGGAVDARWWFIDADLDGWGVVGGNIHSCDPGSGYASAPGDCNDADADIHPDADELCDSEDHNCDGDATRLAVDTTPAGVDADGDGWGSTAGLLWECTVPAGYSSQLGDCDDDDAAVYLPADCDASLADPGGASLCGCNSWGSGPAAAWMLPIMLLVRRRKRCEKLVES